MSEQQSAGGVIPPGTFVFHGDPGPELVVLPKGAKIEPRVRPVRDTKFIGFASMLWDELEAAIREKGFIPESEARRKEFLPIIERIIANRAYDLVEQSIQVANEHVTSTGGCLAMPEDLFMIPDMITWPEEEDDAD